MAVSNKDRDALEQVIRDPHKGALVTVTNGDIIVSHPNSSAYYKRNEKTRRDQDKKAEDLDK
jgi:hypothetical protein